MLEIHVREYLARDFLVGAHISCKSLELNDIEVLHVLEMSDLHIEPDAILLTSETVVSHLLEGDSVAF